MSLFSLIKSWLRASISRSRLEREMDEELGFHLESYAQELARRGMTPEEAARRARIELGSTVVQKEKMRTSLGLHLWDDLRADLRYAVRMLAKSPGFTVVAVGSLALGIGANTAIFILASQVLFDRLAVPHSEQLTLFRWVAPLHNNIVHRVSGEWDVTSGGLRTSTAFPYPFYEQLRRESRTSDDLFAFRNEDRMSATIGNQAVAVQAQMVSGNYYQALGVQPALGRAILPPDDGAPGSGAVAVISDGFWTRYFGRSPSVIGRTIHLNGKPMTIIGINPPGFTGAADAHLSPDVFFPFSMQPVLLPQREGSELDDSAYWWIEIMGRIPSHASQATAQAELETLFQSWLHANAGQENRTPGANADDDHAHSRTGPKNEAFPHLVLADGSHGLNTSASALTKPTYVLLALMGLVLLLACANIANLLLARSEARQHEMGVRLALGAGRARIFRQLLTESLLLSLLGGIAGLVLGYLGRNVLPGLVSSPWEPAVFHGRFDGRVFAFTAAISVLTGLLFGIAPAWRATQRETGAELKDHAQTVTHRRKGFAGKTIVAFQVALSTLLVVGAALFGRTLLNLDSVDPGFRTDHLVLFRIQLPRSEYPPPADVELFRNVEEKLNAVPGVESATLSNNALLADNTSIDDFIREDLPPDNKPHSAWDTSVGQSFFQTMGIPILAGRGFDGSDTPTSVKVAVINQALAREYFPDSNPIGKSFHGYYFVDQVPFRIVGICHNTRFHNLRQQPPPTYYVLYSQLPRSDGEMTYEVRTRIQPAALVPGLQQAVRSIDKNLPLIDVRTQAEQIDDTIQQEKLLSWLTAAFGMLALVLACIGIYGLMAYTVAQRTSEIGIRLALGAQAGQVMRMILSETLLLTAAGILAGTAVMLLLTRSLQSMLYGLSPDDPLTYVLSGLTLVVVALLAGFVPARAAARVNPIQALRHE